MIALKAYSKLLGVPCVYGRTREAERQRIFGAFRRSWTVNAVAVSKGGIGQGGQGNERGPRRRQRRSRSRRNRRAGPGAPPQLAVADPDERGRRA